MIHVCILKVYYKYIYILFAKQKFNRIETITTNYKQTKQQPKKCTV